MRILVTGANGMLGTSVCLELQRLGHQVLRTDLRCDDDSVMELDICRPEQVNRWTRTFSPDSVIHLAADTDLDLCEKQPEHAHRVNVQGTTNVAEVCAKDNILMVYISTASVFDGTKPEPYVESDVPGPINVYARTKLEAERVVMSALKRYFVIRAGWMIGGGIKDKKFVGKIISLLKAGAKEIKAVTDKLGSPTLASDFAENLMPVVLSAPSGLYHMSNKGGCSRFELAKKIVEFMKLDRVVTVLDATSESFPLVAPRPRSEMLTNHNLEVLGLNRMPTWQEGLRKYIHRLCQK